MLKSVVIKFESKELVLSQAIDELLGGGILNLMTQSHTPNGTTGTNHYS